MCLFLAQKCPFWDLRNGLEIIKKTTFLPKTMYSKALWVRGKSGRPVTRYEIALTKIYLRCAGLLWAQKCLRRFHFNSGLGIIHNYCAHKWRILEHGGSTQVDSRIGDNQSKGLFHMFCSPQISSTFQHTQRARHRRPIPALRAPWSVGWGVSRIPLDRSSTF